MTATDAPAEPRQNASNFSFHFFRQERSMVSFCCTCQDIMTKGKLDKHRMQCREYQSFTCIDCSTEFYGMDYKAHTQCISEAQKYQKSLYKAPVRVMKLQGFNIHTLCRRIILQRKNPSPMFQRSQHKMIPASAYRMRPIKIQ